MFDGETSLKKCFLETSRFSEDLDLTVRNEAQLDEGFRSRSSPKSAPGLRGDRKIRVDQQEFDTLPQPLAAISRARG
ncbi:nucleotidyl transferase AbiEii/AbiGii toxin family protein [Bradyrhizobium sp. Pha-3]|uniref:nucleotidyl transferase AbiEii/AbiGii toxin family protein n=1 Tax=Bradyrhizobium sp. Pha-3 TaxID=208375 RepID=UPI0035D46070